MPRLAPAETLHHVTARAPKGLSLFRADADRRHYLDLLGDEVLAREWSLRTYCLMGNHVHLLIWTPEADLSPGIKRVHETFARDMHSTYDGHGHVFGDRYDNRLVLTDDHNFACLRYIARNPPAAELCATADDWPWSGHRALSGAEPAPRFLDIAPTIDLLGVTGYRSLVEADDNALLETLARSYPSDWMVSAVDEHQIPVPFIAAHLGVHPATVYRSLATMRMRGLSPESQACE